MIKQLKSLLSKESVDRDALTHTHPNIKPRLTQSFKLGLRRFTNNFVKLSIIGIISLNLFGLSPVLPFLPQSNVLAQENPLVKQYALPHIGYISTYFSSFHPGIDIATNLGADVHPIAAGTVESVNYGNVGYGNHVVILHQDGIKSLYAHMGKIYVKKDQTVELATSLGTVGLTGHTSGPHTHLEITKNGSFIDPTTVMPQVSNLASISQISSTGGNTGAKPEEKSTQLRKTLQLDAN